MLNYSVAIRTLGKNPEMLREELLSVFAQTIKPQRVIIYIADGYPEPDFRVDYEIYIHVRKGMIAQRALEYREIESPLILLLDDDVYLPPHSVETLIQALEQGHYDCVSPDTFANHRLSTLGKLYCFFSNLTLAIPNCKYAFKIHYNGTLSFLNNPRPGVYDSQSAAGPCALWRKDAFRDIDVKSELWMDDLEFAYADDQLIFYKLFANGRRLGMHYGSGIEHRDGRTARSSSYRGPRMFLTRAKAQYLVWHRSLYKPDPSPIRRMLKAASFSFKLLWMLPVHILAAVRYRSPLIPYYFLKGTLDGYRYSHSVYYRQLRPYILPASNAAPKD